MSQRKILEQYWKQHIFRVLDQPITLSSGILSPVYCDNRRILGIPELRDLVLRGLKVFLQEITGVEAIVGVATGGIALASILAHECHMPLGYVRPQVKNHGTKSNVEGLNVQGKSIVVFEDCVTTGQSLKSVLSILQGSGAHVRMVLSVFDYGFMVEKDRTATVNCPWRSVITFQQALNYLTQSKQISSSETARLKGWHEQTRNKIENR